MKRVDLLIITALAEELEAIKEFLPTHQTQYSKNTSSLVYHLGQTSFPALKEIRYCIVCLHGMGNTESGISTANAISEIAPDFVVMFGIAGGFASEVKLADVLVSTIIVYYELGKQRIGKEEIRPQTLPADALILTRLRTFVESYDEKNDVKFGPIMAGEKVVANAERLKALQRITPKAIGIEMESYGVALATSYANNRPRFVAIRGVSDLADEQKNDNYREEALQNAGKLLSQFLLSKEFNVIASSQTHSISPNVISPIIVHHISMYRRGLIYETFAENGFLIESSVSPIVIDQTPFYRDLIIEHPQDAFALQANLVEQLDSLISYNPEAPIYYFGLAHIPFMFHAGYVVNRRKVISVGNLRDSGEWCFLNKSSSFQDLEVERHIDESEATSDYVVIRVSISYLIKDSQIQGIANKPCASFHLKLMNPQTDIVISEPQVRKYALVFQEVLQQVQGLFSEVRQIHLFLSAPPPVVFVFGQQVSTTIDPEVIVYNFSRRDNPNYGWMLNVVTGKITDRRQTME